jgi:hypothetical protein
MKLVIPTTLQREHEQLHARLAQATKEPAPVGEAAREVARLLHPHFVKEEEYALPPLGLLAELAGGTVTPEMADVLSMTKKLKSELGTMLEEHRQIVSALDKLRAAAKDAGRSEYVEFADALIMHAQSEEQVFYPAAILVGEYVALRLGQ